MKENPDRKKIDELVYGLKPSQLKLYHTLCDNIETQLCLSFVFGQITEVLQCR